MEDLDQPRVIPGAADAVLRQLQAFGLEGDGAVEYQSRRTGLYRAALHRLEPFTYPCGCTRKELEDSALAIDGSRIYPGTCRGGVAKEKAARQSARALRLRTSADPVRFTDRVQGDISQSVETEVGDFVLLRADGIVAYQLAVVVDDAEQGITDVVRGSDLLDSTARQIYLQRLLGLATPRYLHVPVATNAAGEKRSKQTRAADAGPDDIRGALEFLGMNPASGVSAGELLGWAAKNWDVARIPRKRAVIAAPR